MELEAIRRKAQAARQFEVPLDGDAVVIEMRSPTKHESTVAYMENSGTAKAANQVRWQRALLEISIVGWRGVQLQHLLPDAANGTEAVPFEDGAAALLLDAQPDWADKLLADLVPRLGNRQAAEDTAAKN